MSNYLKVEVINKPCAFTLQIMDPSETLEVLAKFFRERHIPIDNLQMHRYRSGDAMLIIHCHIEKDRIYRTVQLLKDLPGVQELERMEAK